MGVMAGGLVTRFELVVIDLGVKELTAHVVFWLFALGWAGAKAATWWQRCCVTAAMVVTIPGFFDAAPREAIVVGGLLLLVWVPSVRVPGLLARVAAVLAASSLYIYLTHWHVFVHVREHSLLLAVLASLVVGVAYAKLVGFGAGRLVSIWRSLARRTGEGRNGRPHRRRRAATPALDEGPLHAPVAP
jgi:hypothetical protein